MALPCVLFSSSVTEYNPKEFVKCLLKVDELSKPKVITDDIEGHEWSFENKYYKTKINLCTTDSRTIGDQDFAESLEAFIHYFDPKQLETFELAKAWIPYLNHIEPDVKMLVCTCSTDSDAVCRKEILEWCIQNGFELIELSPEKDEDEDYDDDFPETTGMERIIQALNAHTWPNLEMKDSPPVQSPLLRQMMKEQHLQNLQDSKPIDEGGAESALKNHPQIPNSDISNSENSNSKSAQPNSVNENIQPIGDLTASGDSPKATSQPDNNLNDINWKALMAESSKTATSGAEDDLDMDVEEFEQLFMKLKVMKDKAETMPESERKKYAEQVAVSFWKAIGGDEDEILGLDDSDVD